MTEIYVEHIPTDDLRLGRSIVHDPRSKAYPFMARGMPTVSVRHARQIPYFNQGSVGSCTGCSAIGALGSAPFKATVGTAVTDWTLTQAVSVYSAATKIDPFPGEYPPTDTGSSGLAVAKVLQARGLISGYQHAFSFDAAMNALAKGPIITGINWYTSFYNPNPDGGIGIATGATVAGGHEVVLDEIDLEKQWVGGQNSWGTSWGAGGRFYMSFATYERLLVENGDATIFVPITSAPPTPIVVEPLVVSPVAPSTELPTLADKTMWSAARAFAFSYQTGERRLQAAALKTWGKSKGLT